MKGLLRARTNRRKELGGYLLESFFHSLLLLFMLFFTVFVFAAGINTMMAARAQNETAIYAAGSGVWTGRAAERCVRMLPGPVQLRDCKLYRQDPADPTQTLSGPLPELCAEVDEDARGNAVATDYSAAEGLRQDPPAFQGLVRDCLNESDQKGHFTPNSDSSGRPQPLRLEISYRQWFFNLCPFIPQARYGNDNETRPNVEDCQSRSSHVVTRNIVFYSQTVREN
jgi:hypothetical protein